MRLSCVVLDTSLHLQSYNSGAADLFGLSTSSFRPGVTRIPVDALFRFEHANGDAPASRSFNELKTRLAKWAHETDEAASGEGVLLRVNASGHTNPQIFECHVWMMECDYSGDLGATSEMSSMSYDTLQPSSVPSFVITLLRPINQTASSTSSDIRQKLGHLLPNVAATPDESTPTGSDVEVPPLTAKVFSKDKLEQILDCLPQICLVTNTAGQFEYFNKEWYRFTGIAEGSMLESLDRWVSLFHPDDVANAYDVWEKSFTTGLPLYVEYRILCGDGAWYWMVANGSPIRDDDGTIQSWVVTVTNIEAVMQARLEALQVREHVTAVLAGADMTLVCVSLEGTVTFFEGNHRAGILSKCAIDKKLSDVWPDPQLAKACLDLLAGTSDTLELQTDTKISEQRVCFKYRLVKWMDPKSNVIGSIITAANVTELTIAEEALNQAKYDQVQLIASEAAAKEASKQKTEFITIVSHEIRTPLSGMLGICELLLCEPSVATDRQSLTKKMFGECQHLLNLVGMVLDFGKVEAGELVLEKSSFILNDVVDDASAVAILARKKKVDFGVHFHVTYAGTLVGDRLRLRQILANGLSNAVKFTETGGSIIFSVKQALETESHIHILFTIEDSGIGIDPAVLPSLFTPFRQADASTSRRYGGTGLGLAITKQLIDLMAGTIELKSTFGVGTHLTFNIPFEKSEWRDTPLLAVKDGVEVKSAKRRFRQNSDISVLLAEDNDLLREIVGRSLRKLEFKVETVADGVAAVKAAQTNYYDVILMDGQMPHLDGYGATAQIRALSQPQNQNIKIIALTASAIQGDREKCLSAGMDAYLPKPAKTSEIEAMIWSILDSW